MQKYTSNNLHKYALGSEVDLSVASGATATSASEFYSAKDFSPVNSPSPKMIEEKTGDRSSGNYAVVGMREYPFSFQTVCSIDRLGRWLYYATGVVASAQDGSTGAYEHVFTPLNNAVLPAFTLFFNRGAEGYRRMTGCRISKLSVSVTDSEASLKIEGLALTEDSTANTSLTVSTITLVSAVYQSNGLIRYTYTGTPTSISSVKNGDVLNVLDANTGFVQSTNRSSHIVVSISTANKTIDVINDARSSNTADETARTSNGNTITVVTVPSYSTPSHVLLRRHSALRVASNLAGLTSATDEGLRNFSFEINNNSTYIHEAVKSADPLIVLAKNLQTTISFTQLLGAVNATRAMAARETVNTENAWRFELEDNASLLGTSTTYYPLLRMEVPTAMGIGTSAGSGGNDELTYDWTLTSYSEQATQITLRNTVESYS